MGLVTRFKSDFLTGLLLLAPLAVTLFVLHFAFTRLFAFLRPVVDATRLAEYTANIELVALLITAVVMVGFIVGIGALADRSIGRRLFGGFDRLVGFIPLVNVIYTGVRQVGRALAEREHRYESVVLVEFPRTGMYSIGFVTGDAPPAAMVPGNEKVYNVFVPNSPNPTGGRLVLVPESQVYPTELQVGQGIRLVVTTGITSERAELEDLQMEDIVTEFES